MFMGNNKSWLYCVVAYNFDASHTWFASQVRVRGHPRATGCDVCADTVNFDQICNTLINYARSFGIIRRNYIDSNSYNFSGRRWGCELSLLTFKPWLRCVCKVHVVSMLRLAMMAFRRSPRGHDWSVVGQAEKVLLWAFYSTDQAKRQEIDLNNILVMIPSNQISTNIKSSLE